MAKTKRKTTKKPTSKSKKSLAPRKSSKIEVTVGMLDETRAELKSDITTLRLEMRAGFKKVDARFKKVDARFNEIDARFKKIDARFNEVDARFDEIDARFKKIDARFDEMDARFNKLEAQISALTAMVHRLMVLVEEQNARNIFVLDGYTSLDARVRAIEAKDQPG